jgi:hypothetical protein
VVGSRERLLDQLAQEHGFAPHQGVHGVGVHGGGLGDRGDRRLPVAALEEQRSGGVDDALAGGPGRGPATRCVVRAPLDAIAHVGHSFIRTILG